MSDRIETVIAEALRIDADDEPDSWSKEVWPHRARVALAALKAARIAVVELPEPCTVPGHWGEDCLGAWPGPVRDDPVSLWPEGIAMPDGAMITVADAQALAPALLAVADAAETSR